jgi:hypothetical protein
VEARVVSLELESVLFSLLCEEPMPSHEALVRWIALYPQFRDDLEGFFVAWSLIEAL